MPTKLTPEVYFVATPHLILIMRFLDQVTSRLVRLSQPVISGKTPHKITHFFHCPYMGIFGTTQFKYYDPRQQYGYKKINIKNLYINDITILISNYK